MRNYSLFIVIFILLEVLKSTAYASEGIVLQDFLLPKDQGRLRAEKPLTIGLSLAEPYNLPGHYQYRPNAKLLIGAQYGSQDGSHDEKWITDGFLAKNDRSSSLYVQYYPFKTAGFYLGLGAEKRTGTFTIHRMEDNGLPQDVRGDYQGSYAGPAFGFTWIWNCGATLGFDISKRKRFDSSFHSNADIDGAKRQDLLPDTVDGTIMLGYSL
jgi:hypothetical protein